MKLVNDWKDFETKMNGYVELGEQIHTKFKSARTESVFNSLSKEIKTWADEVYQYLKSSFDVERNEFARDFKYASHSRFNITGTNKDVFTLIREQLEDLSIKVATLRFNLKIIKISDVLVKADEGDIEKRKSYDTDQILELLMEKLYDLYDDNYYPVLTLLTGNGINLKSSTEDRDLAKTLEDSGLVTLVGGPQLCARLTIDGKRYVEDKRKSFITDYSNISQDPKELNSKIDQIKVELEKLGLGQQIIFEELEELKDLNLKLSKKNWGQVLKGKLIDLGLSKAIDSATMNQIFKELTDQALRLI